MFALLNVGKLAEAILLIDRSNVNHNNSHRDVMMEYCASEQCPDSPAFVEHLDSLGFPFIWGSVKYAIWRCVVTKKANTIRTIVRFFGKSEKVVLYFLDMSVPSHIGWPVCKIIIDMGCSLDWLVEKHENDIPIQLYHFNSHRNRTRSRSLIVLFVVKPKDVARIIARVVWALRAQTGN